MSGELVRVDSDRFDKMEQVANLRLTGISETAIGKQLGLQRKVVIELWNEWKDALSKDGQARDAARDHLNQMVKHYDKLIKRYYDLLDELKNEMFGHQVAAQINSALKAIADLEAKRVDALQKAGLLDANDLGDELAEMEERQQTLIEILRNDLCPQCRMTVARKLQTVTQVVEAVVTYDSDDDE